MASKHNLISRLTRIVELFQAQGEHGFTFEEVNDRLKNSFIDENHSVSLRTFQRDIKDIASSLKIKIIYDKSNKKYVLSNDSLQDRSKNDQLFTIESLKMLHIAQDISNSNYIFIDKRKASGLENYNIIKGAIALKKHLEFHYQKFDQYKADSRKLMPLGLKESKSRWYVVGYEIKNGLRINTLKSFALDRMEYCEATTDFVLKEAVDIAAHFKDYVGVTTKPIEGFNEKEVVQFETSIEHGKYFSTLPIHPSQQTTINNGKTIVSLQVVPTMELVAELLAHNQEIKIIAPEKLVQTVKQILSKNLKQYN